ncbi:putative Nulp1-type [Hibiscus syriacus]|uniref:Nulp1-type n=1 Tax=Hibiscus syriacus TaxID=106335 RepID=A0A6A3A4C0_HIBSY|nr:putative Nulp1-type [Hibiscus syriacus]
MGGGGQVDTTAANNANTALYTTFAISGILSDHTFAIIAGAVLSIGAGLLWDGQGAIMTSYPTAGRKGTYISLFWTIFNLGGLIPFILNYHREDSETVNEGTHIAFMCIMSVGALISLAILSPDRVVRDDAAWASNFFYTYHFNNVNGLMFNLRTRGLNNVFYWGSQMIGSVGIGYVLDSVSRAEEQEAWLGYVGFYKGVQSAGAAVAWQVDTVAEPTDCELGADHFELSVAGAPRLQL